MRISYRWLSELVEIDESPSDLADRLTMAGLEVESVTRLDQGLEKVLVGQVKARKGVPDSDRLTLCQVDVGKELVQIVCGAPNHREGDKVVVALPGATLPGGMKIRAAKIRGVESHGMICSEKELGISDEAAGVIVLPAETAVGEPASAVLGRNDTILELDLTPNRPDALGHLGVAREVSALTGRPLKVPRSAIDESGPQTATLVKVEVRDTRLCPRYLGRVVSDVTVAPSPLWLQQRLRAVGFRPINNIVDVTNYVLMEWGHPLHAFDYDLLAGHEVTVRPALDGEIITTLDQVERKLDPSVLAICDAEKPVALAGVMGGGNTEVGDRTERVFLEAACFQPTSIRKTAKKLGLHSESSHRFERGTDIEGMVGALDRAAFLIQELAGGRAAKGRIDHYPKKTPRAEVSVRPDRIRTLLGLDISSAEIVRILKCLSLEVVREDPAGITFRVPSHRVDLCREVDLIEEVARIYGYNRIPSTLPRTTIGLGTVSHEQRLTAVVRTTLVGLGYQETIHYSFHSPEDLAALDIPEDDPMRSQVVIRNPLSEDQSVLRTLLIPGLIHAQKRNMKRSIKDMRIFETGRVFEPRDSGLPLEENRLAGLIAGEECPAAWGGPARVLDFFDLKGDLQALFEKMGIAPVEFVPQNSLSFLHPGKSAWIDCKGVRLGFMGELHPSTVKNFDLSASAQCFELNLDLGIKASTEVIRYAPVPRFPSVERDIAVILSEEIPSGEVEASIQSVEPELIRDTRLFDLYRGKPIPAGKKSLAYSIRFQAEDRTLTDEEVNGIRDRIVEELGRAFQAALRE